MVLEVAVPKCLPVVCSLDDRSKGVRHERRDILSQGSCRTTCTECYEADGSISTTSLRWLSPGEFVSDAQTVYPLCSQMPCSDTLTHSGVGANSSCGGASIGDTCMVFCAEGYQAVSNETSTLTCACDRCDNHLCLSFGVDFSECFSNTCSETCVVRCSVGDMRAGDNNHTEFMRGSHGHLQGSLECAGELAELSTIRMATEVVRLLKIDVAPVGGVVCARLLTLSAMDL